MITFKLADTEEEKIASVRYVQAQKNRIYTLQVQDLLTMRGFPTEKTGVLDTPTVLNADAWFGINGYRPVVRHYVAFMRSPEGWQAVRDLFETLRTNNPETFTHGRESGGVVAMRGWR